jgi:hypothetical protein
MTGTFRVNRLGIQPSFIIFSIQHRFWLVIICLNYYYSIQIISLIQIYLTLFIYSVNLSTSKIQISTSSH